ncbi:MAG TPA: PPC domain-containing protein [Candidatus Thermoplasmatota archaeon]|nr:PPC domain-containing protein [Candidatus Thermoplasmatota archaeon]
MSRWTPFVALSLALLTAVPVSALMAAPATTTEAAPLVVPDDAAPKPEALPVKDPDQVQPGGGLDAQDCSLGLGSTSLSDGVGVTGNLANVAGANCEFNFVPSTGFQMVSFVLTLTTSDFDLYVRKGAPPTTALYDCRPFSGGTTTETCNMDLTDTTTWYVMVNRFSGSGDFTIKATQINTCSLGASPTALTDGTSVAGSLTLDLGAKCLFTISTPTNLAKVTLTPATDNFNLYVRRDAFPTTAVFDCSSLVTGAGVDTCSVPNIPGTTLYAMAYRPAVGVGSADFTIKYDGINSCTLGNAATALTDGVSLTTSLTADLNANCLFSFTSTSNTVRINMTPAVDNYNLYLRRNAPPTTATNFFDCSSTLTGVTTDTCSLSNVDGDVIYAMVLRPVVGAATNDFTIRADGLNTCSLGNGAISLTEDTNVTGTLTSNQFANCLFSFTAAAGVDLGKLLLFPASSTNNFDLIVRAGSAPRTGPTTASRIGNCFSNLTGTSTDSCGLSPTTTLYALVHRPAAGTVSADFNVKGQSILTCSLGLSTIPLVNNVATLGVLANEVNAACNFSFAPSLTEDTVRISMSPPATGGDFDLYVKKGSAPTTTVYDCRPFLTGNATETCTLANDGTTVYVLVRRFSGTGTFSVTASAFSPCSFGNGDKLLSEGAAETASLSSDAGAACFFSFTTDPLADTATFDLTPNAGADFDLYVKTVSRPTTSSYGCRSIAVGAGAGESCEAPGEAVTFFGMVTRVSGSGDFTVNATSTSSCSLGYGTHALNPGQTVEAALDLFTNAKCYFSFEHDPGADFAHLNMTPPDATPATDFDMYVRKGAQPTTTLWDCRPFFGGNRSEDCFMLIEDATPYQVLVRRFSSITTAFGTYFTITAKNFVVPTLENGIAVQGVAEANGFTYYKVVSPVEAQHLTIATAGDPVNRACVIPATPVAPQQTNPLCNLLNGVKTGICANLAPLCPVITLVTDTLCPLVAQACAPLPRTDVDLYVRHISDTRTPRGLPTTSLYTCRSANPGSAEQCTFDSQARDAVNGVVAQLPVPLPPGLVLPEIQPGPQAGRYFIGVRGTIGPADFSIVAAWAPTPIPPPLPTPPSPPPLPPPPI